MTDRQRGQVRVGRGVLTLGTDTRVYQGLAECKFVLREVTQYPVFLLNLVNSVRVSSSLHWSNSSPLFSSTGSSWRQLGSTHTGVPEYLSTIVRNPALQQIRPKARARKPLSAQFVKAVKEDSRLAALMDLPLFDGVPKPPFFYPAELAASPAVEEAVWGRVLSFVIGDFREYTFPVDAHDEEEVGSIEFDPNGPPKRLLPLLVCKLFYQRLAIPYLYETPCIYSADGMRSFVRCLKDQPSLGSHVRRLSLYQYGAHNTQGIRTFRGFFVEKHQNKIDAGIFARFPQIRNFSWECKTVFKNTLRATVGTFDKLKELTIKNADPSFVAIFSRMELPCLTGLGLLLALSNIHLFLDKHGMKIQELRVSPAALSVDMHILTIFDPDYIDQIEAAKELTQKKTLKMCDRHVWLERIVFDPAAWYGQTSQLKKFLSAFDCTLFPSLQEIEHPSFDWDIPEYMFKDEISEPPWVKWAEKFHEAQNRGALAAEKAACAEEKQVLVDSVRPKGKAL
ncbi:hypothetical protein FB45DRAFT_879055 [Roridomyces roridus]|uniref:Uncharacterized protein n=1 Tax=Roridomyces roridus TaxID=1738132 RepID=A0AAD7B0D8_9AGAR|nr:hypothetical protein FB45DRAFT_879055 [Roridomyces roridus]